MASTYHTTRRKVVAPDPGFMKCLNASFLQPSYASKVSCKDIQIKSR